MVAELVTKFPSLSWKPESHYLVRKSPPLSHFVSTVNRINIIAPDSYKSHCNAVFSHTLLCFPSGLFPSCFKL